MTEELLETLCARAASENRSNPTEPFATPVEKAVIKEWSRDARTASLLRALLARYGLTNCLAPDISDPAPGDSLPDH
jgi:hypothetical protein